MTAKEQLNDAREKYYDAYGNYIKTIRNMIRFTPAKREALDGKVWWCVYDTKKKSFSSLLCFGKYKTRKACQSQIDFCLEYHPEYLYGY